MFFLDVSESPDPECQDPGQREQSDDEEADTVEVQVSDQGGVDPFTSMCRRADAVFGDAARHPCRRTADWCAS